VRGYRLGNLDSTPSEDSHLFVKCSHQLHLLNGDHDVFVLGVKWLESETAEMKNAWNYTFTPAYASMTWCLIKYGRTFLSLRMCGEDYKDFTNVTAGEVRLQLI
jgi:hypothetical protein